MIYISSACIKNNYISEVITLLAERGVKGIELSGGTKHYENIERDLKTLKEKYDLVYSCHAYFPPPQEPFVVNLASCNDRIYKQSVEHYMQCISMLKRINCKVLSVHAGFMVEVRIDEIGKRLNNRIVYNEENAYDRFCSAYQYISKRCVDNGIELFLENNVLSAENYKEFGNHNYMMMVDFGSIMKMKDQMDFNLLLDLGHLYVSSNTLGLDFQTECMLLKQYVRWMHLSENNGLIDEHKPLREGSVILEQFREIYNANINVTLETVGNIDEVLRGMQFLLNC